MYLYKAQSNDFGRPTRIPPTYLSRIIGSELNNSAMVRSTMKDHVSAKLQVKGEKQAAAVEKATLTELREQIGQFTDGLKENARINFLLQENINRRDLQEFQCIMIGRLELVLKNNIIEKGLDFKKYKIGGYDGGTYGI